MNTISNMIFCVIEIAFSLIICKMERNVFILIIIFNELRSQFYVNTQLTILLGNFCTDEKEVITCVGVAKLAHNFVFLLFFLVKCIYIVCFWFII